MNTTTTTTTANTRSSESLQRPSIIATWVDHGIGEAGMHKYIKERFETLSSFISQWLYFDSSDDFTSYVEKNPKIKLISVMSGGMARLLVSKLSHHPALHSVYVFCADLDRARQAMEGEMKVKGIFTIEDEVYEQMADDLSKILLDEGLALARVDERSLARRNFEEAKRLLSTQANSVDDNEKKARIEEIDVRLDQLLV